MDAILRAAEGIGLYPDDCFTLLVIASVSCVGLLGVWAALGRPHWFVRVAILLCVLSLGLLIPAYEAVVVFLVQALVVFVPLAVFQRFREARRAASAEGPSSPREIIRRAAQFRLVDLTLTTVAIAVVAGFLASVPREVWTDQGAFWLLPDPPFFPPLNRDAFSLPWVGLLCYGTYFGAVTLLAACLGLGPWLIGRRGRWLLLTLGLPVLSLAPTAAPIAVWLVLARAAGWIGKRGISQSAPSENGTVRRSSRTFRRLAQGGAVLLSTALVLPALFTLWWLLHPAPIPEQAPLPSPNGYDALVEAGKGFDKAGIPNWGSAPRSVLATFVANNEELFALVRSGLDQPCRVPLRYTLEYVDYGIVESFALHYVAQALQVKAKLAELDGRTEDAIGIYMDLIRVGSAESRGGLGSDFLGQATQHTIAMREIYRLRDRIPPEECRRLIDALRAVEAGYEPVENVSAREDAFRDCFGWAERLYLLTFGLSFTERELRRIRRRQEAYLRLLVCELALRVYEIDTGTQAASLTDLVPEYLGAVPTDPFSGGPIVYRIDGDTHVVYSVGPDETDEGGDHDDDLRLDEPPPDAGN